ncbi:ankyrin repeat-containing domain protein [Mycena latifolia]|nr:ankyrin repeat-containing domain protein [Mycena latifolia]
MAEVLGTVASAIQLVDTALKAREYIKDFYNAPTEQRKLFTGLDDLKPLLTELQKRVAASPSTNVLQHMAAPLGRFKATMDKFTAKFELPDGPLSKLSKQLSWTLWNKKEAKKYWLDDLKPLLTELQKRVAASPSMTALQHMEVPLARFKVMMDRFTAKFELPDSPLSKLSKQLSWTLWNKKEANEEYHEGVKWTICRDAGEKHDQEHKKDHNAILATVIEQGRTQQEHDKAILATVTEQSRTQQEQGKAAEEKEILDWITSLNFFQRQADVFRAWQPGTGEWLLSDAIFKNWILGSGGVLWCRGIPTALNSGESSWGWKDCSCAQFQKSDTAVACIYLNHKERELQTPENLLASVWKQLIVDRPLPPAAHDLYKHHHLRDTRPSLTEVFDILQSAVAQHSKVYIIVDALDEYPEEQRNILLEHLSMLLGPITSLMLTSRPHVTLDDLFPDMSGLEISATEDNIRRYVDKQIQKSPRLSKHVQTRPELHDEIKSKISSNADGMFLLAKLHTESLAAKNTVKAVREALQHLPQNLNHTYEEAMNRIKNQNEEDRQLALQALTWVAYAKRPLSVAELREALAIEPDATTLDADNLLDISIVLSVCAGLIIVDEAMSVVQLIHFTTQGYFDSIQRIQFPDAHTTIASQCLAYLSFDEFSKLDREYMFDKGVEAHPLVRYSQHLLLHAAEASRQLDLQPSLTSFLEKAYSWKHIWYSRRLYERPPPWDYYVGDWPLTPSLLWLSAASNLMQIATYLLGQPGDYDTSIDSALSVAVFYGYIEMTQLLIKKYGANVNCQGGFYGTALQAASHQGHELVAQFLIEKGADVNAVGGHYGPALQAASEGGHESVAQFLIEKGADVNAQGGYYGTALQAASLRGHESISQFLIEKGADVNAEGGNYGTALQAASEGGHESVAQFLIEKEADVNAVGGFFGTALQAASEGGHESVAQFLIEKEADVNAVGGFFGTALQAASCGGHESVARFLIEKGADVNAVGGPYGTALRAASCGGHESVAQFLIEKGADVNAQGGDYGTALQAASEEGHELVARFLIEKGADVNAVGGYYGTALHTASYWGHESIARFLIEMGADVNAQGGKYGTALQAACVCAWGQERAEPVVQFLIEMGADVNAQGGKYGTALQAASRWGYKTVAHLLIENGAHLNQTARDTTALWVASAKGYEDIVQLLIESRANLDIQGYYGTALQAASVWGRTSVVRLLIENGAHHVSLPERPRSITHGNNRRPGISRDNGDKRFMMEV